MTLLRVLGSVSLSTAAGTEIRSVTAQPKRIALLAYLAYSSHSAPVRRDTVLALFWPELDATRARHALRQALYHLRRELTAEILESNGDEELRIRAGELGCDVCEFRDAMAAGAYERALALYRGELLPGLYVSGAAEFEQWLDQTRAQLRGEALRAASELHHAAQRAGDREKAAEWARRAHQLAPFDEGLLRRLLEALEAAGDGSGAVLAYDAFAQRSQRELGVAPSAESAAIVARIRARRAARRPVRRAGDAGGEPVATDVLPPPRPFWQRHWRGTMAAVVLLSSLLVKWAPQNEMLNPALLAIPPFRVLAAGADSVWLSEGMSELLSMALQIDAELDVVEGRAASSTWHALLRRRGAQEDADLALDLARSLGAGLVLHGAIIRRGEQLVVMATLRDVRRREVRGTAAVAGPENQLLALVDEVATRTLGTLLREDPTRMERLTSTSYPAVRAYLAGRAAMRRGEYAESYAHLKRALEIDSTFAVAALSAVEVAAWSGLGGAGRYERWAYDHRDRLTPRDTAQLRAYIGESYTGRGNTRKLFDATQAAAAAYPDNPQLTYQLGDRYFHVGEFLELPHAVARSRELIERAVRMDSGFTPAREHLVELGVMTRDAKAVRRYRDEMLRIEPNSERTPYLRWLAATFLQDAAEQRRLRAALDTMNATSLTLIVQGAQEQGVGLDDAERAAAALLERALSTQDRARAENIVQALHANLGHAAAATRVRPLPKPEAAIRAGPLLLTIRRALFSDAPPPEAAAAFAELHRRTGSSSEPDSTSDRRTALYGVLLWKLWHGDTTGAAAGLARLQSLERPFGPGNGEKQHWVRRASLEALLEHAQLPRRGITARPALARLDSLMQLGEEEAWYHNLVLIRIFNDLGQPQRALAAARRRLRGTGPSIQWLAPMLLAEARAAAATGDRSAAMHAYRHYLALRAHPDPALQPLADSARREYRALLRE